MEAKPLQIVPSSHNTSGGGPQKKIDDEVKRVDVVKEELEKSSSSKCFVFTEAQRCELDHQVFIFNHFAYNLPLPHHLLQFPSNNNMSEYSRLRFDHGTTVDPEPHRCRRTDGKKWRCSKKTVPDQKYCERHMHRGRNRSRKPVETSQVNSPLTTKPCGKSHTKPAPNAESAVSNPNPLAIQHSDTSSYTPSRSLCVVDASSANNRSRNVFGSATDYHASFSAAIVVTPCSTLATAIAPKVTTFSNMVSVTSDNRSRLNVCKKDDRTKSLSNNMVIKSVGGKGSIICDTNGISAGTDFSPKSVLQVSGCNHSYLNDRNNIVEPEPEPGRCRRTDGKKWRCKSDVLPGQKYCATHMHRGAKKRFTNHELAITTTTTTTTTTATATNYAVTLARLPDTSAATGIQKAYCRIPNTKLSMSVPESAPFIQCEEKSGSSSDTDTDTSTTITDTMNECSYVSF